MIKFYSHTCSLFLIIAFCGCDKVDQPFEKPVDSDTTNILPPEEEKIIRKILIEDFTGHTCGNCPQAADMADQLMSTYGKKIIVASVHAGFFARPKTSGDKFLTDFRTDASEAYNTTFGNDVAGNPNGFINRMEINGKMILNPSEWPAAVEEVKDLEPKVELIIDNVYEEDNRNLSTTVSATFLEDLAGNYRITLYLVEDSVIDWQKDYSQPTGQQDVPDYVHRHVLRDNINGTWGDWVSKESISEGEEFSKKYNYIVNADWNINHCSIIAYIHNAETYEVIQVEEGYVK